VLLEILEESLSFSQANLSATLLYLLYCSFLTPLITLPMSNSTNIQPFLIAGNINFCPWSKMSKQKRCGNFVVKNISGKFENLSGKFRIWFENFSHANLLRERRASQQYWIYILRRGRHHNSLNKHENSVEIYCAQHGLFCPPARLRFFCPRNDLDILSSTPARALGLKGTLTVPKGGCKTPASPTNAARHQTRKNPQQLLSQYVVCKRAFARE
jgi:hypothetical protein